MGLSRCAIIIASASALVPPGARQSSSIARSAAPTEPFSSEREAQSAAAASAETNVDVDCASKEECLALVEIYSREASAPAPKSKFDIGLSSLLTRGPWGPGRGTTAAACWIVPGGRSRRRRGRDVDIPWPRPPVRGGDKSRRRGKRCVLCGRGLTPHLRGPDSPWRWEQSVEAGRGAAAAGTRIVRGGGDSPSRRPAAPPRRGRG